MKTKQPDPVLAELLALRALAEGRVFEAQRIFAEERQLLRAVNKVIRVHRERREAK